MSPLEAKFINLWNELYPDTPLHQEVKIIPKRQFRFDFVHRFSKVAIEINGGNWVRGRHTQAGPLNKEYEKLNLVQMEGYQVFILDNKMITEKWLSKIYETIRFNSVKRSLIEAKSND